MAADDPTPDPAPTVTSDPPQVDDEPIKPDDEWQAKARKHERDLKRERKAREDLEAKLAEYAEASKSEQEKALEQARKEAAEAAKAETASEFRARILKSEIRAQAAGKFADPDDAIRLLDLDDTDVFDDAGEVQADALTKELDALLERKPHLKADPSNGRPLGDVDAGKGAPAPTGTPEEQHNQWLAGVLQRP